MRRMLRTRGSTNLEKMPLQFLIAGGQPSLSIRARRLADFVKVVEMVSSSCPGENECHDSQRYVKMKLAILKVIWNTLQHAYQTFKRKGPPRMYRAVKPQIFCKMKRHVLIW